MLGNLGECHLINGKALKQTEVSLQEEETRPVDQGQLLLRVPSLP